MPPKGIVSLQRFKTISIIKQISDTHKFYEKIWITIPRKTRKSEAKINLRHKIIDDGTSQRWDNKEIICVQPKSIDDR